MAAERFSSVWDAIESDPAEAATLKVRAELMRAIEAHIRRKRWTQAEAAKRLGVTQPRVSDLMRGKIDLFSLDKLYTMANVIGLRTELRIGEAA